MDRALSIPDIEKLVAERATHVDGSFRLDHVHVYEEPSSDDDNALIVQVSARRPNNQQDWTRLRIRFTQAIRDALLERGDERYPLVQVFGPEEWASRNA
jgi:hypothetical protein